MTATAIFHPMIILVLWMLVIRLRVFAAGVAVLLAMWIRIIILL